MAQVLGWLQSSSIRSPDWLSGWSRVVSQDFFEVEQFSKVPQQPKFGGSSRVATRWGFQEIVLWIIESVKIEVEDRRSLGSFTVPWPPGWVFSWSVCPLAYGPTMPGPDHWSVSVLQSLPVINGRPAPGRGGIRPTLSGSISLSPCHACGHWRSLKAT